MPLYVRDARVVLRQTRISCHRISTDYAFSSYGLLNRTIICPLNQSYSLCAFRKVAAIERQSTFAVAFSISSAIAPPPARLLPARRLSTFLTALFRCRFTEDAFFDLDGEQCATLFFSSRLALSILSNPVAFAVVAHSARVAGSLSAVIAGGRRARALRGPRSCRPLRPILHSLCCKCAQCLFYTSKRILS